MSPEIFEKVISLQKRKVIQKLEISFYEDKKSLMMKHSVISFKY